MAFVTIHLIIRPVICHIGTSPDNLQVAHILQRQAYRRNSKRTVTGTGKMDEREGAKTPTVANALVNTRLCFARLFRFGVLAVESP